MENFSEYTDKGKTRRYVNFDKIENVDDAYLIGYLSSDGSFSTVTKNSKQYFKFGVCSTDIYLMESFHKKYCPDQAISYRKPRSSKKVNATKSIAEIWFPTKMNITLKKFGIFCPKINRRLIGIPKEYMSSYVLGMMDADGCFAIRNRKDCRTPRLNIHIVSCAEELLKDIQRYIEVYLNISSSIYNRKDKKCSEFRINHTNNAILFGEWIYSKLPSNYNYKKHSIFTKYCTGTNSGELLESIDDISISSQALNVENSFSRVNEGSETSSEGNQ
jgi:hypothetical protein